MKDDPAGVANSARVVGLELYRYFLTDAVPGAAVCVVLAYYLRQYREMREIAEDYAFLSEVAGGFFLVGLLLGLAFGVGLVTNLLSAMALGRITDAAVVTRAAARLYTGGGVGDLGALARQVVELAAADSRVASIGLGERIEGPRDVREVRDRVGIWLDRAYPEDFQRAERYGAAAALCRSLAGVVLLTWLVESCRLLTGQGLGVAPAWFPLSAAVLVALLLCSAYASVRWTGLTLQLARQRLHELSLDTG